MTIDDVIRECVIALYSSNLLEKTNPLVLKGGTALRIVEKIQVRLSTDMDFSVSGAISEPDNYFDSVKKLLEKHFKKIGFEVIDAKHRKKPSKRNEKTPPFWGGWEFTFKLSDLKNKSKDISYKRRSALIPDGSNSSTIAWEISEHEYCGSVQKTKVDSVKVTSYSSIAMVAEKLRAICQAHPDYPYAGTKDRARDYLDLYLLVKKYHSEEFYKNLKGILPEIFKAKDVPLDLLRKIFDEDFSSFQKGHFQAVREQVGTRLESFEFYQEQVRILVSKLLAE